MGGFGSGRREYATTPTVEECRHLDIDNFTDAVDHPGRGGPIYWGDPDDPEASISTVFLSDDHLAALADGTELEATPVEDADADAVDAPDDERATAIYLDYTVTSPGDDESRSVSYHVPLEYTEPNFGGVRPWFRCPSHAGGCGRRVGKLYLPIYTDRDRFLCRECYDLGYRSSRTSGNELERAEQRYRKAFAKADAEDRRPHPNNPPYTPDRPKGTHRDTFDDLLADVRKARHEWDDRMNERMRELLDQYDTGAEHAAGAFGYTDR
jgi:hypothetical protein